VKKLYLPPVLESNARKGYLAPSQEVTYAALVAYASTLARVKGLVFKKPGEKLVGLMLIYYPVDVKCIDSKCMALNPVTQSVIKDHGVIGSLALLFQNPSPIQHYPVYVEVEAGEVVYTADMYDEEYSIPPLKVGEARFYVPFTAYMFESETQRLCIEPPITYLAEYPNPSRTLKAFEALRKLAESIPVPREKLLIELAKSSETLYNPATLSMIDEGLKKLYELRVLSAGDVMYIKNLLK